MRFILPHTTVASKSELAASTDPHLHRNPDLQKSINELRKSGEAFRER